MILKTKSARLLPLFLVLATIAGCKSEPSQDDVDRAVTKLIEDSAIQMKGVGGGLFSVKAMTPTVNSVKKLSCTEENEGNAYDCQVETEVTTDIAGRRKSVVNLQMVNADDGWHVTKMMP